MTSFDESVLTSEPRDDDMLGDGWQWSSRHMSVVMSSVIRVEARGTSLYVTNRGRGVVKVVHVGEFPLVKIVALTHTGRAIAVLRDAADIRKT